ncbi:sugar diacid recognition domain-containing protein [Marinobacter xestospongiae]|uniref:Sugar diacid recognition domain-containing protein n=1 Tax=Marinobacter xestospongiae TaxID=994319 RepID=A0ABU3W408_9GAMM|nr:sugar diacid recognition domain-containing protein [Marinobacter xestospongiae]MDV2080736.1 sugar diacid recognition domain-containing protein [Marinobacter xestospongiae]
MAIELDAELAQRIVVRTTQIIDYNVNVMNAEGRIIASGDSRRLGQVHDGALLAIAKGDTVLLDEAAAARLSGVRPGVNLVLSHQQQLVGVIGLTGDPDQVKQFGLLVKMAAELIIEQAQAWQQTQWGHRQKEEFVLQWVQGHTDWPVLVDWARQLQVDLDRPRVAMVMGVDGDDPGRQQVMGEAMDRLAGGESGALVAMQSLSELVILHDTLDAAETVPRSLLRLLTVADRTSGVQVRLAVGQAFEDPRRMAESYQTARQTLQVGRRRHPDQSLLRFADDPLPVLLSQLEQDWRRDALVAPVQRLLAGDRQGHLLKTLRQYFQDYPDQQRCARQLHIHRNTLRYRLNKIEQLSGCSLTELDSLMQLYVALALA